MKYYKASATHDEGNGHDSGVIESPWFSNREACQKWVDDFMNQHGKDVEYPLTICEYESNILHDWQHDTEIKWKDAYVQRHW